MSHLNLSSALISSFNFQRIFKVRTFHVLRVVTFSFGSLMRVVCHLVVRTVASVDLFEVGGSENGRFAGCLHCTSVSV